MLNKFGKSLTVTDYTLHLVDSCHFLSDHRYTCAGVRVSSDIVFNA